MKRIQVLVERISLVSSKPFSDVVAGIEKAVGHPDMHKFARDLDSATTFEDLQQLVDKAVGAAQLMEFARFNLGQVLQKEHGADAPRIVRFVVGNPVIMKQMAEHVSDAGSYAPVTILVDEREDGVHLSYDLMSSYLAPYASTTALKVARDLDSKIEALLSEAAG